jgi:hypothetical protein
MYISFLLFGNIRKTLQNSAEVVIPRNVTVGHIAFTGKKDAIWSSVFEIQYISIGSYMIYLPKAIVSNRKRGRQELWEAIVRYHPTAAE